MTGTEQQRERSTAGLLCGLGAYVFWGGAPIYFKAVSRAHVPPVEFLAHRVVWSALLLFAVLYFRGRLNLVGATFRDFRTMVTLAVTTVLIAINWLLFVYAVDANRLTQASMGYFLSPLVSVALGSIVLKEKLRPLQLLAIAAATIGVIYLPIAIRELPTIGLGLAFSFGIYGLLRKITPVDGSVGLAVETLMLTPLAWAAIEYWRQTGQSHFMTVDRRTDWLLLAAGPVTTLPLVLFTEAARRLKLAILGFLQYISPTLQLLVAVLWFQEPFPRERQIAFAFIWVGIAIFCFDSLRSYFRGAAKS